MRKITLIIASLLLVLAVTGCKTDADIVSENISKEADTFNVPRRIVFYNGITDSYMLTIEGLCSLGNFDSAGSLSVTCKVSDAPTYKKHYLGLSDNVTYFVEQLDASSVSKDHYIVVFKPTVILPIVK
jgi:hypothetical protein